MKNQAYVALWVIAAASVINVWPQIQRQFRHIIGIAPQQTATITPTHTRPQRIDWDSLNADQQLDLLQNK